ncbi:MAG: dihydrofolate reductase [Halobacteriovoraceae bacterium]|nr:dihydrofolate reductase [Halobacteriovoraceae bacterium]
MIISMIVAMGSNRQIGKDNQLLWHIPEDLKNFKKLTIGKTIVMGRKTYESIGRPLPNRENIVLSRQEIPLGDVKILRSVEEVISYAESAQIPELVICGGENIYAQFLPRIQRFYLSKVMWNGEADAFCPQINLDQYSLTYSSKHPQINAQIPAWEFEQWDLNS